MPSVIACPSCAGQLRLPDELLGQEVRCPTCSNVFVARATPSLPDPAPVPRSDSPPDLSLNSNREPEPAAKPRGLVGAVELKLSLDDEATPPRMPSRPAEPSRSFPPSERDRHDEPEDDLRPCPTCGKRIHHDSTRCFHCGWRLDGNGVPRSAPTWDRDRDSQRGRPRGPERRDLEPSRGVMILVLGILSLVCTMVAPLGVLLGLVAWVMGQGDLKKIKAQQMEPDGGLTTAGWVCGMIGTLLNSLLTLMCLGFFSLILMENNSRPATSYKQPVQYTKPPNIQMKDGGKDQGFKDGNNDAPPRPQRRGPGQGPRGKERDDANNNKL